MPRGRFGSGPTFTAQALNSCHRYTKYKPWVALGSTVRSERYKSMEVPTLPLTWTIPYKNERCSQHALVHTMAGEPELLEFSGLAKVKEFLQLKYPRRVVKAACSYMAASTGERTWLNN